MVIGYSFFGEGSHISTNQKLENGAFLLLIGINMRPFPENTALYFKLLNLKNSCNMFAYYSGYSSHSC